MRTTVRIVCLEHQSLFVSRKWFKSDFVSSLECLFVFFSRMCVCVCVQCHPSIKIARPFLLWISVFVVAGKESRIDERLACILRCSLVCGADPIKKSIHERESSHSQDESAGTKI